MSDSLAWPVRRDRAVFFGGAAVITVLAWVYMVRMASVAHGGEHTHLHGSADLAAAFAMWTIMMIAMMLPAALPFVFAFAAEHRRRRAKNLPYVPAGVFLAGYFAIWTVFSALAAVAQLGLHRKALLSATMSATSSVFAGGLLIAAGVYQWTPWKDACVRHCRSPLSFLLSDWRDGPAGAFRMGIDHGLFCLGCCWLLMALPFAGGVMNLTWMAGITAFILGEGGSGGAVVREVLRGGDGGRGGVDSSYIILGSSGTGGLNCLKMLDEVWVMRLSEGVRPKIRGFFSV